MKTLIYLLVLLQLSAVYSQKRANIWYFNTEAGLDFNDGAPVPLLDGQLNNDEGSASIADIDGNLVFYTDGETVYNKNHQVMENGTGLLGHISSAQSALIVPRPGFGNIYYIFTTHYHGVGGLTYSTVDMDANDGLGRITEEKNVVLVPFTTEQLTAVVHRNGTDVWVATHGYPGDAFYTFLVTAQGVLTTPVVSNVGTVLAGEYQTQGTMKFSPDGSRLASAEVMVTPGVQLLDFDNASGVLSNPIIITDQLLSYGLAFSPSGKVLYVNAIGFFDYGLYQYDLTASDIAASEIQFLDNNNQSIGGYGIQLAPDGKIYFQGLAMGLSAIHNPDVVGPGCNWEVDAVGLGGRAGFLGLPSFIESYFNPTIYSESLCSGSETQFSVGPGIPPQTAQWEFGDGTTSDEASPRHTYQNTGTYTVSVTAMVMGSVRTITKEVTIIETPQFDLVGNASGCTTNNMSIRIEPINFDSTNATYLWEFDGQTLGNSNVLTPSNFGTYTITVSIDGCSTSRDLEIEQLAIDAAFTEECVDYLYTLGTAPINGSFNPATTNYTWSGPEGFNADTQQVVIQEAGAYTLTLTTDEGCIVIHTFYVLNADCPDPNIPRGISPNGDGMNDIFDLSHHDVKELHIFSRYGLTVFSQANYTTEWHGQTDKGDQLPVGTYYYYIQKNNGQKITGWVYINR